MYLKITSKHNTSHLTSIFCSHISHIVPPGLVLCHGSSCGPSCHTHYGLVNPQREKEQYHFTASMSSLF